MRTLDHILGEIPLFEGLEPDQVNLIAGCGGNVRFAEEQMLFREGDAADTFFLIRHGTVAIETFVPVSGAVTIETVEAGDVVGWSWLFAPYRWHFDARALTVVRATAFDGACLRDKCAADPALGYQLMSRFAQLLVERMQWMRLRLLDVYGDSARR
jgi:CRP-like cAMP-binding protein